MTVQPVVRPRRLWYGIAIVVLVLGVGAGIGGFVFALRPSMSHLQRFETGQSVRLTLPADARRTLYVSADARPDTLHCAATPDGLTLSGTSGLTMSQGDESWNAVYQLHATRAGTYRLTCTSPGGAKPLAVGAAFGAGRLFGGILTALGCPCVALVFAGIVCLVVALRRHARIRELRERAAPPT
jgi:hypothetical protein